MENNNKNEISVLVIGSVYPRHDADAEVPWLRATVRELVARGCRVAVVAPSYKGLKSHGIDGVRVHRFRYAPKKLEILTHDEGAPSKIASNPFMQLLAVPYILSGSIKTLSLARKLKPDVIHAHWPFPHGFMALAAKFFRKTPVVLNFHGAELLLSERKRWIRPILRTFIKRADLIVANSSFTAAKVKAIYNKDVHILAGTTIESRLDPPPPRGAVDGKFRVLFVGRHIERKGIEYLVKAAALLDPSKFQVRIVGHGDLTEELKEQAAREAPEQVVFLGKLSNEELHGEYENAGCFVLPAIVDSRGDTEGLGIVTIEAAERGVPIVASDVGGIPDVVIDGKTGLLVREKSPRELADAIARLYGDADLRLTLVKNCADHVNENFLWDGMAGRQIELYRALKNKNPFGG